MIEVTILFFEGCPNHQPAVQLAHDVLGDLGLFAVVSEVEVTDETEIADLRFLGSPSVRVNGHDIEPGADDRSDFAFGCRAYGSAGVPPREWMIAALENV